jgi:hypothetical protein
MRLILRVIIILAVTAGLYVAADVVVGYFVTPLITAASRDPECRLSRPALYPPASGGRARARRMARTTATRSSPAGISWPLFQNVDRLARPNLAAIMPLGNASLKLPLPRSVVARLLWALTVYGPEVPDIRRSRACSRRWLNGSIPPMPMRLQRRCLPPIPAGRDRLAYEFGAAQADLVISFGKAWISSITYRRGRRRRPSSIRSGLRGPTLPAPQHLPLVPGPASAATRLAMKRAPPICEAAR